MPESQNLFSAEPLILLAGATDYLKIEAPQNREPFFWGFDVPSNKKVFFLGQDLSGTKILKLKFYNAEATGEVKITGYIIQ
ncbi:hypothetical protein GNK15_08090 [Bacillus amyloliquefaciens]|uniref:hypothetical protein n=1 Tax=Bacillus amyloliquefaciens group TaxID=1938374 RepID=UPI00141953B0|nr:MULTISPECIES: hypothetical protein [Bacillus amyloliquefaciens group]MBI0443318.1 hypothetical protein [Bacillus velezensis]NIH00955.1 hypothetical protein [Bacillus amyloliquefaciens]